MALDTYPAPIATALWERISDRTDAINDALDPASDAVAEFLTKLRDGRKESMAKIFEPVDALVARGQGAEGAVRTEFERRATTKKGLAAAPSAAGDVVNFVRRRATAAFRGSEKRNLYGKALGLTLLQSPLHILNIAAWLTLRIGQAVTCGAIATPAFLFQIGAGIPATALSLVTSVPYRLYQATGQIASNAKEGISNRLSRTAPAVEAIDAADVETPVGPEPIVSPAAEVATRPVAAAPSPEAQARRSAALAYTPRTVAAAPAERGVN